MRSANTEWIECVMKVTYVRASRYGLALDIKSRLTYSAWSHPNRHFAKSLIIFFLASPPSFSTRH